MSNEQIIDEIMEIRNRNNKHWVDILKLAFRYAPEEASEIVKDIANCDSEITVLCRKLEGQK